MYVVVSGLGVKWNKPFGRRKLRSYDDNPIILVLISGARKFLVEAIAPLEI